MSTRTTKSRPKAWSSIRTLFRRPPLVPGALNAEDLARAFQQERSRTDRNGRPFCMVIFWAKDEPQYDLRPLAEFLRGQMRLYDLLGHLDQEHLAVLLPETPPEGAEQFAQNVRDAFDAGSSTIRHEICTYPLGQNDPGQGPGDGEELPVESHEPQAEPALASDLSEAFLVPVSPFRRLVDILVSGSAILLLSPVYILAGLAVKLTTPGPIIFRQMRAGRGGKPFAFYKFRSMYIDAEARRAALADQNQHDNGPIFKMKNDPRITPVGKFLRKTSIDELPQLFNVLKGDMTLIGPRPPMLSEVEKYDLWQRKRLDMTGGITCIWQVSGRSEIKFDDWVRMDIQYQQKRSLWFDLKLLFKTIGAVVSGRGAY
ncbi:MAG: sugar transferase [Planctomycetota bacterium]